jgi:hypothetical protein
MSLPTTTMSAFIAAIIAALRAHSWPSEIASVGHHAPSDFDDEGAAALLTPAILLHIPDREMDPDALAPPGRIARRCDLELHGVLSVRTPNLQIELIELAEAMTALVQARESAHSPQRGNRWGLADAVCYPIDPRDSDQGAFAAGLNGYGGRVLTWSQTVYVPDLIL